MQCVVTPTIGPFVAPNIETETLNIPPRLKQAKAIAMATDPKIIPSIFTAFSADESGNMCNGFLRKSSQITAVSEFIPLDAVLKVALKIVAKNKPGSPGNPSKNVLVILAIFHQNTHETLEMPSK